MRSAFREWGASLGGTTLAPSRPGTRRCTVLLPNAADAIATEITLDPYERTTSITATPPQLPALVKVIITSSRAVPEKQVVASHLGRRALSETLDEATCEVLMHTLASGPLGHSSATIDIRYDCIDVTLTAPTSVSEWQAAATAIVALCGWLVEKWPASYRT
jgi:hypothetical protein